ncbi:MAG: protein kinase [Chloroflexales bacterium]|nr:protein kinase [Chloroflexales bacterium]
MRCPNCSTNVAENIAFCPECGMRLVAGQPFSGPPAVAQAVLQDRYVITHKLGQGGMGAVYRAADRRLSTVNWAVKEMSDEALTNPAERQQAKETFRHEAELLARLAHPNLPRVTDHFEESGKNYLVMEYVPGETMAAYIGRTGLPQPPERVFNWARQLCDVLEYLHTQKPPVIFRDLKPANIMITPQGSLKLIDFGIARIFKPGQAKDTQAFGTIGYSAPEQYGRGQTDARSDVYSLGVLLHQLLTGYDPTATPFRLPPASRVNPQLNEATSAALACATETDPDKRFGNIHELHDALLGATTPARPAVAPAPPPPFMPAPQPISQPMQQPGSTILAQASLWTGVGGLALGIIALASSIIARNSPLREESAWYSLYLGCGLAGLAVLGLALLLGIVALIRKETAATQLGRRHAVIGIVLGSLTMISCCISLTLAPSSSNGHRPHAPMLQLSQANERQI